MACNQTPPYQALVVVDTDHDHLDSALMVCLLIDMRGVPFRVTSAAKVVNGEINHLICNYNIVVVMTRGDENSGGNTPELVATLRGLTDLPLLVVGPPAQVTNVSALLQGADMYMSLPLHEDEFFARMESLMRRCKSINTATTGEQRHQRIYGAR